jgi:hypothetical protein
MALTGRLKILLAVAIAVVAYVVMTRPDEQAGTPVAPAERARPRDVASTGQGSDAKGGAPKGAARNVSSAGSEESARLYAQLAHRVSEGQSAGALFKSTSWYTAPPPPPPAPVIAAPPPPAPTAPALPFSVMGSYARPGERTTYFLTRGDRVFDVRVGDTIDNTYSVDGDAGGQLRLTYKPLNIQQTLPIGGT